MTRILILLVAGSACALLPRTAVDAGCHAVHVQKQAVVAYQPVYNSPYLYQVGTGLQLRAAIEVAKEELRAEMRAQQLTTSANNYQTSPNLPAPERLPLNAEVESHSIIKNTCIGCHGTNQKAIDALPAEKFLAHLTGDTLEDYQARERMMVRMLDGSMPPKGPLPGDVLGNALGQIVGAETAPK